MLNGHSVKYILDLPDYWEFKTEFISNYKYKIIVKYEDIYEHRELIRYVYLMYPLKSNQYIQICIILPKMCIVNGIQLNDIAVFTEFKIVAKIKQLI